MNSMIDLRSDTVTKPTKEMLAYMMQAEVGDDVFTEDPTVNKLEQQLASMFSKEAALFCPSGTMSNQIALRIHTQPGDEVICDIHAHIYHYETGGMAVHSGIQPKLINTTDGILYPEIIEPQVNTDADWLTKTSLIVIENTCNRAGGTYYSLDNIKNIYHLSRNKNLKLHIDGARIFNAIVENDYTAADVGAYCDTISVCLSKGLGAPVGSLLVGSKEDIKKARRIRKQMGGGMRQVGILAAAGRYALKYHITDLKRDHLNAKKIYDVLRNVRYVKHIKPVHTNIIIFELMADINPLKLEEKLKEKGVRVSSFGKHIIRMVTHRDITNEMMDRLLFVLREIEKDHEKDIILNK